MDKNTADLLFDFLKCVFYDKYDAELNIKDLDKNFVQVGEGLIYLASCLSECNSFARTLSKGDLTYEPPSQRNELASSLKTLHSSLRHLTWQTQQVAKGDYTQRIDFMGEFSEAFNTMVEQLKERQGKLIEWNENLQQTVKEKTQVVVELQNAILETMAGLIDGRDVVTGGHIERTQEYLRILLTAISQDKRHKKEVSTWDLDFVLPSAQLHDVGKISIEDSVLKKPGRLTEEEFEAIKKHTTFGAEVIQKIKHKTSDHAFLEYARIFALSHHEKWNGSGYPNGLKGEEIPLLGRILAIADVYDALVSSRSYKKPFPHEKAVNIIKNDSGTHFDPSIVELFLIVADQFDEAAKFFNRPIL